MTFPAGLTLVTVTCQFDLLPSGGAAGTVRITYDSQLTGPADDSIVPYIDETATLNATGGCTIAVPATNDPGWTPANFAYTVTVTAGGRTRRGTLQLDYQTTAVNLADLIQWNGAAVPGQTYIPLSQRGAAGGVAALDADGDVTDASGAKITGGGGGGAAPGSTVVSETSYGQSATAGTGTAYSRATHSHGTPALPSAADVGADASGTAAAAVAAHIGAADPHPQYALETALGGAAALNVGTGAGTVAAGNDSRLSDARTPTTHAASHADGGTDEIAVDGSQITTGTVPIGRIPTGTSGTTVPLGNDARFSDSRTPTAHASSHASAGSDPVTIAESQVTNLTADLAAKAPLASPAFTGTPSLPTGTTGVTQTAADSSTKLATTAFVTTADNLKAPLASPTFTGTPAAPTATAGTNTTQVATTAFATGAVADHAAAGDPHPQYDVVYVESGGTYAIANAARSFVGADDPATKGFTLAAGDRWYEI